MNFDSEVTKGDWYSTPVLRPLSAPEGCSLRSCVSHGLAWGHSISCFCRNILTRTSDCFMSLW